MREFLYMTEKNTSQLIFSTFEVYNTFFVDQKCFVSTDISMPELYYLDGIAHEDDKIVIINEIQENELLEKSCL